MSGPAPARVLVLLGPTGSGKTAIVDQLDPDRFEVVGCDSRQLYRHMPIGTATPSPESLSRIHHHLVACLEPDQTYSAGKYAADARVAIRDVLSRGKHPLVVGGTGFYYQALRTGLFGAGPPAEVRQLVSSLSAAERLERLRQVDPRALEEGGPWAALHPNDDYRISRALEVFYSSGERWTLHWERNKDRVHQTSDAEFAFEGWILEREASVLEQRLQTRAKAMVEAGIAAEAGRLAQKYGKECPALRTLGYDVALEAYEGRHDQHELTELLYRLHRRYAQRQRNWFRREKGLQAAAAEAIASALG